MVQMALNVQKSSSEIHDDKSRCIIQGSSVKRVETESTTRSTLHEFTRQESDSSEAKHLTVHQKKETTLYATKIG